MVKDDISCISVCLCLVLELTIFKLDLSGCSDRCVFVRVCVCVCVCARAYSSVRCKTLMDSIC